MAEETRYWQARVSSVLGTPVDAVFETSGQVGPIYRVTSGKTRYILKTSRPSRTLPTEARMLDDMRAAGVRVPEVAASGDDFVLMEYIDTAATVSYDRDEAAAHLLLALHRVSNDARMYGYYYDTPIASFWQRNEQTQYNWALFYGQMRLLPMVRTCYDGGRLEKSYVQRIEKVVRDLYTRIDMASITPSLLHGDIWSGNILYTKEEAVLIDPALYFGDREVDLAFIEMFNTFGPRFWDVYTAASPLSEEYASIRRPLYQLYPYLVHIALYGAPYVPGLARCLRELGV